MLANITPVAWLFIYHAVLPPRKFEAVSQLHTLTSRSSSVTGLPLDQTHSGDETEAAAETSLDPPEHQARSRSNADADIIMVQPSPLPKSPTPLFPSQFMSVRYDPSQPLLYLALTPPPQALPALVENVYLA